MEEIEPKSEYLKKKLKQTNWKDRGDMYALLELEKHILENFQVHGYAHSLKLSSLKSEYDKEYGELLKELHPYRYSCYLAEKKAMKDAGAEYEKEEKEREKKEKKAWIKAGGKA